jgi:hypothetical protein
MTQKKDMLHRSKDLKHGSRNRKKQKENWKNPKEPFCTRVFPPMKCSFWIHTAQVDSRLNYEQPLLKFLFPTLFLLRFKNYSLFFFVNSFQLTICFKKIFELFFDFFCVFFFFYFFIFFFSLPLFFFFFFFFFIFFFFFFFVKF